MGWSSYLCFSEDSNGCGCMGKRSSRHPRRLKRRHERKEMRGNGRDPMRSAISSDAVSVDIRRGTPKFCMMPHGKSEEAIVAVRARTLKPAGAKGLCLGHAYNAGGTA